MLDSIQSYFNCGKIIINNKNHTAEFVVEKLEELELIIIPHFELDKYPLFCAKLHAFNLFKEIVNALFKKDKRTIEGRRELLKYSLSMNVTTNRKIERINTLYALLGIEGAKEYEKELIKNNINSINTPISSDFISGFIDGDGSFFISFQKDTKIKIGFNITNDRDSKPLLEGIKNKFNNIGTIIEGTKKELVYVVNGLNQINDNLIPFMDENPIFSERASHYDKFRTVALLLKREKPLTLKSKINIVNLAYEMNKKGKHRILSKSQYTDLLKNTNFEESPPQLNTQ